MPEKGQLKFRMILEKVTHKSEGIYFKSENASCVKILNQNQSCDKLLLYN